jgi:hypothetical protein
MGLIKFILWASLSIVFLYFAIVSAQNLAQDGKELEQAQNEYDNVVKYGCANPTVMTGLVSCPNG